MDFFKNFFSSFIFILIVVIMLLLSVAFFTLYERKILGFVQIRKGPLKVGYLGIFQPIADAMKLFSKKDMSPKYSNMWMYMFSPLFMFFIGLFIWLLVPLNCSNIMIYYSMIFLLVMFSFSVYGVMFSGWSSNSKYSLLGSVRSISQSISYEVILGFLVILLIFGFGSFNILDMQFSQKYMVSFMYFFPMGLLMYIILVVEVNRSPFDLSESESELVSGFNVEYGGAFFSLIFLGENLMILFISWIQVIMFWGKMKGFLFSIIFMIIMFSIIMLRGVYPRIRFDALMFMCWLIFLPFTIMYLYFFLLLNL